MLRVRYLILAVVVLLLAGLILPFIMRGRVNSDRIGCQNHLRDLGLLGVRNATTPGQELPVRRRDELPPGSFLNATLPLDQRMSWYVYTLNVLDQGIPNPEAKNKHRPPPGLAERLSRFDARGAWNSPDNTPLANYRLSTAICPAQVPPLIADEPVRTNYVALGGLGVDTPVLAREEAGSRAGAYYAHGPTLDSEFHDGLRQTAQILETNSALGPWLQGGNATLRGLEIAATPYFGVNRPFGGCHPGGAYASMADGSVPFIVETIDPAVFRAMLTRAGGPEETNFDSP